MRLRFYYFFGPLNFISSNFWLLFEIMIAELLDSLNVFFFLLSSLETKGFSFFFFGEDVENAPGSFHCTDLFRHVIEKFLFYCQG